MPIREALLQLGAVADREGLVVDRPDAPVADEPPEPPAAVLSANKSVILARAAYVYSSPIQLILPKPLTFNRTLYLRPRRVDAVLWSAAS